MNSPDTRHRDLFDRQALANAIARCSRDDRKGVLELARGACEDGRRELCRRIEAGASGAEIVAAQTFLIDALLQVLLDRAAHTVYPEPNPTTASRLSLLAVGGYGRGDLAPRSDIDILFLHPYKLTGRSEQIVEHLLYMMWDLGFAVGHATRSVADCLRRARDDMTIRTSVLESRHVWGDQLLYEGFRRRFLTELVPGTEAEFVAAKLRERDERHVRAGDSRYLLEPNVKDGKGGLRDPPRAVLDSQVSLPRRPIRRARRAWRAQSARVRSLRAGGRLPLAGPGAPPHRLRPGGGSPRLRQPAGRRGTHGIRAAPAGTSPSSGS